MGEYIKKDKLIKAFYDEMQSMKNTDRSEAADKVFGILMRYVNSFEAADVQPVKRGEWEKKSSVGVFRCSLCQHIFMLGVDEIDEYHFCPNCGARMDKS